MKFDHSSELNLLLAVVVLIAVARLLGELAKKFNKPAVLGELLAGILLGPTVLGHLSPEISQTLFPKSGAQAAALDGIRFLAVTLFLMVAGMEVDLPMIARHKRTALTAGLGSFLLPFGLGLAAAYWLGPYLHIEEAQSDRLSFCLFVATALGICALPVLAKILMDLRLLRTDVGMVMVAAAIFIDLLGWNVFGVIMSLHSQEGVAVDGWMRAGRIGLTIAFATFILTAGRWLIRRMVGYVQAHASWPAGILGFLLVGGLSCAAITQALGIHSLFGAFLFGVAAGDCPELRHSIRQTLEQFIGFILTPIFFASIGLKADFAEHFDPLTVGILVACALLGKIPGGWLGSRLCGMRDRESLAVGVGMSTYGAMEIILGLVAMEAGIIGPTLFVAIVILAIGSSLSTAMLLPRVLRRSEPASMMQFLSGKTWLRNVQAANQEELFRQMAQATTSMISRKGPAPELVAKAVAEREALMPTGMPGGLAVPHARLPGLSRPVVVIACSQQEGWDFEAPDGSRSTLVCMILTPVEESQVQLELLSEIAGLFRDEYMVKQALGCQRFTDLLALIKTAEAGGRSPQYGR